jgi:hypothetical protein
MQPYVMKDQPPSVDRYQHPFGHTSGASEIILTDPIESVACKARDSIKSRNTTT